MIRSQGLMTEGFMIRVNALICSMLILLTGKVYSSVFVYAAAAIKPGEEKKYFETYQLKVIPILARHRGTLRAFDVRPIVKLGKEITGAVILEFPDAMAVERFYRDPDYVRLNEARKKITTHRDFVVLEAYPALPPK